MNDLQGKYQVLLNYLKELGSVAIAFSGGVDSTFLLAAAKEALGDNVIALTAKSCLFPESESGEAEEFCKNISISYSVKLSQVMEDYKEILEKLQKLQILEVAK